VRQTGGPWPDQDQLELLRAAVGEGDAARTAWERWRAAGNVIERLDSASYRLLPQLYRNLEQLGVNDETVTKLRGVYRHAWYCNHVLFHAVAPLLRTLAERGVATMALKGGALATLYPGGLGARPMDDVDLFVREADVAQALEVLGEAGFEDVSPLGFEVTRRTLHSAPFRRDDSIEIDLHWRAFDQAGVAEAFWTRAEQGELGGAPVLVASPADQLLQACVHGVAILPAPMRWIADAVGVIRATGARLDWEVLVATAREHEVTLTLWEALDFLRAELAVEVPPEALDALAASPSSIAERLVHRVEARHVVLPRGAGYVELWDRYRRLARGRGERRSAAGFLTFVAEVWNLPHRRALAPRLARKALQIARHGVSHPSGQRVQADPVTPGEGQQRQR
jgi:hypothetical protein